MEVEKNQKYSERKSTYEEQRKKFEQKTFFIIQFYF